MESSRFDLFTSGTWQFLTWRFMELHSYPKIYAIGHAAIPDIFTDTVIIEEKVDGSQFSFLYDGEEMRFYSKNARVMPEIAGMFKNGVDALLPLKYLVRTGWIYRGEYLQKPKHNCLNYNRVPKGHVILFDVTTGNEVYLSRQEKEAEAARLGLEIVPLIYEGNVSNPEDLISLLDRESILGGQKIEGFVVKNYTRFSRDGKAQMGKFVREDFKETQNKDWKAANPTISDIVERIIATIKTEKRWEKAVFHLRDRGMLTQSPRDIGPLMKEVQQDLSAEEMDFIKTKLAEWATPRILRASTSGLPEWYKEKLLKDTFKETL
jgi:hypothetical protein